MLSSTMILSQNPGTVSKNVQGKNCMLPESQEDDRMTGLDNMVLFKCIFS